MTEAEARGCSSWGASLALLLACSTAPVASQATPGGAPATTGIAAPTDPISVRLPAEVRPSHYRIELAVDPRAARFSGHTRIDVESSSPRRRIALHSDGLDITAASVESRAGTQSAAVEVEGPGRIALVLADDASGPLTLSLSYSAPLEQHPYGLFSVTHGDQTFVSSQMGARRVFPCFDDPSFKATFDISLEVPAGYRAFSNAALAETERRGATDVFRFATTSKLPTYTLAFAVGDFDVLDAPIEGLPHRLITLKGQIDGARYAATQAPRIIDALRNYLDAPFPFAKLDEIALPAFHYGGMENAGLVTYREDILLAPPGASAEQRLDVRRSMTHELSHMWFGNLVTLRWWDELWLQEGLTTWMGEKVFSEIAPELDRPLWAVTTMLETLANDTLPPARTLLRNDVGEPSDLVEIDIHRINKGFALLRMLEMWLGPDVLRAALRLFVARHRFENAGLAELAGALSEASGKPVQQVLTPYVTEPGAPLVSMQLTCNDARVTLRYDVREHPTALGKASGEGRWFVPTCLRLFSGQREQTACVVLDPSRHELALEAGFCPEFFYPNAGEMGYYRWQIPETELVALATRRRSRLSLAERSGLSRHATALLDVGAIAARTLVVVLRGSALDQHRLLAEGAIAGLERMRQAWPADVDRKPLARFADRILERPLRQVNLRATPGEPFHHFLARRQLLSTSFLLRNDRATLEVARVVARRYLADAGDLYEPDVHLLLPIAASRGGRELQDQLLRRLATTGSADSHRFAILAALGSFDDPELARRSYDAWLAGALDAEALGSLWGAVALDERRAAVFWRWYSSHADAVAQRLGDGVAELSGLAAKLCTPQSIAEARAHFSDARFGAETATRLATALAEAERCSALRERYGAALVAAIGR